MCHQYLKQRMWGMHTFTSPSETCHRHYRALYIPVSHVACRMSSKILDHNSDWRPREYTGPNRQNWGDSGQIWEYDWRSVPTIPLSIRSDAEAGKGQKHTYSECKQKNLNYLSVWTSCCSEVGRGYSLSSSLKETTSIWPKVGKNIELVDHKIIILLVSKSSVWPDSSPIFSFSMESSTAHPCYL